MLQLIRLITGEPFKEIQRKTERKERVCSYQENNFSRGSAKAANSDKKDAKGIDRSIHWLELDCLDF